MKDSLLLPLYIAGMFLLVAALLSAGMLIYLWNTNFSASSTSDIHWVIHATPAVLQTLFPLAVITTLFSAFVRLARAPGLPFLSFIITLLAFGALLYFGYPLSVSFARGDSMPVQRNYNPLEAGTFNSLNSATVYPQRVDGLRLSGLVISDASARPRLKLIPTASFDPVSHQLIPSGAGTAIPVAPSNPTYSTVFAPGPVLAAFSSDVSTLNVDLARSYKSPLLLYPIECSGLMALAMGCFLFTRVSRWPLLNAFLVLGAFRGLFRLNALLGDPAAARVADAVLPKDLISAAPAIGLGSVGVFLILLQILFIRNDSR